MVTKGMVHSVHKVVIRLSFGEVQGHKVSKALVILPRVSPTATEGDLKLMEAVFR